MKGRSNCLQDRPNFMEQSPSSEVNSRSLRQQIPRLLWNRKAHYHAQKSSSQGSIQSQINSLHTLQTYIFKIHFNIFLPSKPRSSKCSLPFRFSGQNSVWISHHLYAPWIPQISSSLRLSLTIMFGVRNNSAAPNQGYAISSSFLLVCPSQVLILSSASGSQITSIQVDTPMWQTKFHAHIQVLPRTNFLLSFDTIRSA